MPLKPRINMKRICITFIIILALSGSSQAEKPEAGDIIISVSGFKSAKGIAIAYLFRQGDNVMKIGTHTVRQIGKIDDNKAVLIFKDLPFDEYAVTVFHDENNNGKLDHSFGLPAEPMGFSNGFKMGILTGLPGFDKMKFRLSAAKRIVHIQIN